MTGINADRLGQKSGVVCFFLSSRSTNFNKLFSGGISMLHKEWDGFTTGNWTREVNVGDFIQRNYTLYEGDEGFLAGATEKTQKVWQKCEKLLVEELEKGVLDVDTQRISGIDSFEPGYIDKDNEVIVGLQTDSPLKRIVNPYGGIRMAKEALEAYGYTMDKSMEEVFTKYRKTHNQGVFDSYTEEIKKLRSVGILTGLPDAYGRGRIIGDYRRIALYGINFLIKEKEQDLQNLNSPFSDEIIRLREEVKEQIRSLKAMARMALSYGIDISKPAQNAREAVQFLYFGYLAGIKENNGAAMSLGRCTTFLDIYIERDLCRGELTEKEAQELIDQFVIKLRMARHLRTPDYNELFAGDPTWVTEAIGGVGNNGKPLVTKTSYRFLHTLINLGPAPEPNMTILWSEDLPLAFKKYCAKLSILTDSLQYENDDLMRPIYGDDYGIACCVSAMAIGKQMQFFGARCNLGKSLLYAINGGRDELTGELIVPKIIPLEGEILDYGQVKENFSQVIDYVAEQYVNAMNIIHYMHDKYSYESGLMALHDTKVERLTAFGIAGLSVVADSLSAIKYGQVKAKREEGIAVDFTVLGDFPKFGNDDDRVDDIAVEVATKFITALKKHRLYRDAIHTLSVLTITSNVVYGKKTGATPDGRKAGEAFAPGANPMHGRDTSGALASLNSVAKLPYADVCQDGISNTFTLIPESLGGDLTARINSLVPIIDGYFSQGGHHLNVNVLNRTTLMEAMENPAKFPSLTIRVSGYAVNFNRLTKEQKIEVINRTFHHSLG